jgi:crotonobetainyl-CoA:carnitine CoA-transferase CaiB-like acyl-CoA transferase
LCSGEFSGEELHQLAQPADDDRIEGSPARLALSGVCVVEAGQGVSAAFAAKLMALLGATVVKVEPPQGDVTRRRGPFPGDIPDPEKSGLFAYLNAGKRGVTLDLRDGRQRQTLDELLAGADIFVHNVPPYDRTAYGLESDALVGAHPRLIVAAISAYGGSGPRAGYRAYELNAIHASGLPILSPRLSTSPELPPLKPYGQQAEFQGGLHAAAAALAAFRYRMQSGAGQAIDVSEQECIAAALELSLLWYTYEKKQTSRMGWVNSAPTGIFRCTDGMVELMCVEQAQWQRLAGFLSKQEWLDDELFNDRQARTKNADAINAMVQQCVADRRMLDVVRGMQEIRVPAAPVSTMADIYNDQHLRSREFLVPLPVHDSADSPVMAPGVPFKSSAMQWSMRDPAPRLGEHNREVMRELSASGGIRTLQGEAAPDKPAPQAGPLSGVRVLDFSWVWAGPFCTLQLAHLGAEVIRIETTKRPGINRIIPPYAEGKAGLNRAGSFNQWNQGKRSLQLDLSQPQAAEIARQLARHCDVAVENFAPGVIERFGLGYQALRAARPDLIMLSISGYGQTGPYARFVSYGLMIASHAGLHTISSYEGDGPREVGISYADPTTGIFGASLIAAALIHRDRTGQGQHIDLSMLESMEMVMPEALLEYAINGREPRPMGNHDRWMAPHNCYKTRGDAEHWVTIAVGAEEEWRALCEAMGKSSMAADPRFRDAAARKQHEAELDAIITAWTVERDRWEITEMLQRAGVAAIPTFTNKDVALDAHMRERGFLVELPHPEIGAYTHAGVPWTMSRTPCKVRRAAPRMGEDTDYVLGTILGYAPERIAELRDTGIIR